MIKDAEQTKTFMVNHNILGRATQLPKVVIRELLKSSDPETRGITLDRSEAQIIPGLLEWVIRRDPEEEIRSHATYLLRKQQRKRKR